VAHKNTIEEAEMDQSTIIRRPRQRWLAGIAAFVGVLLGLFAIAVPAYSGEYYEQEPYPATGYQYVADQYVPGPYQGAAYRSNCCGYPRVECCGSRRAECCGYRRPDCCVYRRAECCGCPRCGNAGVHVFERKVVEREYYERRDGEGWRQPYRSSGYAEPGYPVPSRYEESRPPFPYIGYAGMRGPSPRDGYEFEPRRPPADVGMPGAYYYNGYGYPE
jgi:hypothetical protein